MRAEKYSGAGAIRLSKSYQQQLLSLLREWFPAIPLSQWQITALAGLGGGTFRLQTNGIDWVARYYGTEKTALFVRAKKESSILKQLLNTQLAPNIIKRHGAWFFFQWLEGEHLTHQQLFGSHIKLLAHQIAKLHQQKPFGLPLDLWHELSVYWYHIDRKRLSPKWLRLHHDFLRQPRRTLIKYAPAHMDLHPENILLSDSGIKFIDWEYAADIDTADSLMTFFAANQLNSAQQTAFLHEYCAYHHYTELNNDQQNRQHPQQQSFYSVNVLKQRILSREPFILYMMLMWYEVRWQQTKDNAFLAMSEPLRRYFSLMN